MKLMGLVRLARGLICSLGISFFLLGCSKVEEKSAMETTPDSQRKMIEESVELKPISETLNSHPRQKELKFEKAAKDISIEMGEVETFLGEKMKFSYDPKMAVPADKNRKVELEEFRPEI